MKRSILDGQLKTTCLQWVSWMIVAAVQTSCRRDDHPKLPPRRSSQSGVVTDL